MARRLGSGGDLPELPARGAGPLAWGPPAGPWSLDITEPVVESPEPEPGDFWRLLRRRRWTIALVFLATVAVVTAWTFTVRPVYRGTTTVRIEKEEPRVLTFDQVVKETDPLPDSLQTQQRLLQSRALANRVIANLHLSQHPDFNEDGDAWGVVGRARSWVRDRLTPWLPSPPPAPSTAALGDLAMESPITRAFETRLSVDPVRGSRLAKVSFESYDPVLAARVANNLSDTFVARALELRADTGRYATGFLGQHMRDARARLEGSEQKLSEFTKAHGINFVAPAGVPSKGALGGGSTDRQDLVTQQLATLSDALLKARGDRIGKESLVRQAEAQDIDSLPAVLQNPHIMKLKGDLAGLETEYQQAGQTYRPEYPRMRQLQQSIAETRTHLKGEVERVVKALQADYQSAVASEKQLERAMGEQRAEALKLGDHMVEYNLLRRDVDANRELYTSLLTRLKETQVSAGLLTSPISVVDRAEVPLRPIRPHKTFNILMGALVGLIAGIGVAFLLDRTNRQIATPEEIDRMLGVPRLGLIPDVSGFGGRPGRMLWNGAGRADRGLGYRLGQDVVSPDLEQASHFAESFRYLRTSILYGSPGRAPRTVMVTSPHPGDGKTSLAMNLASSLAQVGSGEVLLVDGNLRSPQLHAILNVTRSPGMSSFLAGRAELDEVIRPTFVPGLSLIPGDRCPDNPADLLAGRRLEEALETLRDRFAHIIVDAPPLFGMSDSLNLAARLDGVVLVLRHGRSRREDARSAVEQLWWVRANLLGVVVNGVDGDLVGRAGAARGRRRSERDDDAGLEDTA